MKKIILILCVLFLVSTCFASVLSPKGKKETIKINENTQIIIPEKASKEIDLASKGLVKYINEIYGLQLEVKKENEATEENYISLGDTIQLNNANITKEGLTKDGYKLASKDNNLFIIGYDNYGALNGVYCLLEEDLGCRWWDNYGNTTIPTQKKLEIKFVPRSYSPDFPTLREPFCSEIGPQWEYDIKDKDQNYIYGNKIKLWDWCWLCHTSFQCCSPENFKEHPDWFSMENGVRYPHQLCWSNPETIAKVEEKLKEVLETTDWTKISLSPQDSYPLCDCPNCRALDEKEGTKSATLIKALNQIIDDMQKIEPDFKLICLAYLDYVTPPKTIKPHKDLSIHLCSDSSDWFAPFATYDETVKYQKDLKAWRDWGTEVITWNYVVNYDHYILPQPNYDVVAKNIKLLKKFNPNINGVFLQGNYGVNGLSARDDGEMKAWIWSKLLWNPILDQKQLKKEFIKGYYGTSAKYIEEYENLLDDIYTKNHKSMVLNKENDKDQKYGSNPLLPLGRIRFGCDVDMYTDDFINKSMDLLNKGVIEAKDDETLYRVNTLRKSVLYLILGKNLGYYGEGNKYHSKEFDITKKDYYLNILNDLETILKQRNITTIAEVQPMENNSERYLTRWSEILTRDLSKYDIRSVKTNWLFTKDENNSINPIDNNFDTKDWIEIPCDTAWETTIGHYDGYGWYKRIENFTKEDLQKKHIYMVFAGVDEDATVYINGKLAIEHTCESLGLTGAVIWCKSFVVDIKPYLTKGENQIKVKVYDREMAGGIYAPVRYVLTDEDSTEATIISLVE